MDLGADWFTTWRMVVMPSLATALLEGGMFSFDEAIVTTFTSADQKTLPIWIWFLNELFRPRERPITNVVAVFVMLVTFLPIILAQWLTRDTEDLHCGGKTG